jgi:hypothetical protein
MVGLVVQLSWPSPTPAGVTARLASPPVPTATAPLPLDYPLVLERSLFAPARGGQGAGGVGTAAAALSDYTLVGVVRAGAHGQAVFRATSGEVVSLHEGEALLGWRLAAVERNGVVLQQGDVRRTIPVSTDARPPGAP